MSANVLRKISGRAPIWLMRWLGNLWPPYLGAGIRIVEASPDYRRVKVALARSWWNANYVGTQFGGSMYAMIDPFYMLMLINNLGRGYVVWDKAARIEFKKPGRTRLTAEFQIDEALLADVRARAERDGKLTFDLPVEIRDADGDVVAEAVKTLYVRKK